MALDLDAFLKELGVSGDEETALRAALGKPERLLVLEKNQLRQADYSKQMNALTTAQTEIETVKRRLDAEAAEWATLSASEKTASTELRASMEKLQERELKLTQRIQRLATDNGLDPAKALEGIEQTPVVKVEPQKAPEFDSKKFVSTDAFGSFGNYMFNVSAELPMLAEEHRELTGERLDTRKLMDEILKRSQKNGNIDPRTVWVETFDIETKRQAKTTAAREAEIRSAEQRGFERARSEAALPVAPSTTGVHSPVLRTADGKARTSVLSRPQPEQGVQSAAAALATGKYRQQPVGSPPAR